MSKAEILLGDNRWLKKKSKWEKYRISQSCYCLLAESYPTFCDPIDCSPQGSFVHKIPQARIVEWVPISFSRGSFQPRDWNHISCIGGQILCFTGGSEGKEFTYYAEDLRSVPGLERSPGGGHGNPLQYSCLENPPGQRSLEGHSLWGHKESDMTKYSITSCST